MVVTPKSGDKVCESIESREGEAPAEPRMIIGTRQTQRLRGSVALPIKDNPTSLRWRSGRSDKGSAS